MNSKTKGVIAGVAGIALLAGGSTFALWTDGDTVEGGVITSGNLDVAALGEFEWRDVSTDRQSRDISLNTFVMVPGDTIQGRVDVDAALEGDNMIADLAFTLAGSPVVGEELLPGLEVSYTVLDVDGEDIDVFKNVPIDTERKVTLRSAENDLSADGIQGVPSGLDGEVDFTVVVTAAFKEETSGQEHVQATAALEKLDITLTQSRTVSDAG